MLLRRELMVLLTSQAKPPIRSTPLLLSTPTRPPFTRSSVEIATFYFHFVTIKRGFLLPTLKTKKKEMAPLFPPRAAAAPNPLAKKLKETRRSNIKKTRLLKRRRKTSQKHKYHLLTHSIKETATINFKRGKVLQASPSSLAALLPLRCACKMSLFSAKGQA